MLSLPVRQQAGQAAVPKNKYQDQNGKGVYWVSSLWPWLGVGRQVWSTFPQHQHRGPRMLVQILEGSQPRFSGWRISTHCTLPPDLQSGLSLRLGGSTLNVKVLFQLISKTRRLLMGSSFRQGLAFAGVGSWVQGCNPAFGTGQVSEGDRSPGSPQNPVVPEVPRSLAHGCFHRVCFCSVFCSINRRGQWGH